MTICQFSDGSHALDGAELFKVTDFRPNSLAQIQTLVTDIRRRTMRKETIYMMSRYMTNPDPYFRLFTYYEEAKKNGFLKLYEYHTIMILPDDIMEVIKNGGTLDPVQRSKYLCIFNARKNGTDGDTVLGRFNGKAYTACQICERTEVMTLKPNPELYKAVVQFRDNWSSDRGN